MQRKSLTILTGGVVLAALVIGSATAGNAQQADSSVAEYLKDPAKSFILEKARLIDGNGGAVRSDVTIVVEQGRIAYVGALPSKLPEGAKRIDLSGHTVLPGLVMMHEHINYFSGAYVWDAQPGSVPKLLL